MKKRFFAYPIIIILLIILLFSIPVSSHPGSLDENGGHFNRKTGDYHYHSGINQDNNSTVNITLEQCILALLLELIFFSYLYIKDAIQTKKQTKKINKLQAEINKTKDTDNIVTSELKPSNHQTTTTKPKPPRPDITFTKPKSPNPNNTVANQKPTEQEILFISEKNEITSYEISKIFKSLGCTVWDSKIHLLSEQKAKIKRALLQSDNNIKFTNSDIAYIKGSDENIYEVTLSSCTCPDFSFRKFPCKHIYHLALTLSQKKGILQIKNNTAEIKINE